MNIAIVSISNMVQNGRPILLIAAKVSKGKGIFNKRCCRVLFVFNKSRRSNVERIHLREKLPLVKKLLEVSRKELEPLDLKPLFKELLRVLRSSLCFCDY